MKVFALFVVSVATVDVSDRIEVGDRMLGKASA